MRGNLGANVLLAHGTASEVMYIESSPPGGGETQCGQWEGVTTRHICCLSGQSTVHLQNVSYEGQQYLAGNQTFLSPGGGGARSL